MYRITVKRVTEKRDADLDIHDWFKSCEFVLSDEASSKKILMKNKAYISVFFEHIRARIRVDDENKALLKKEIKTLTDDQEELHTQLNKLEQQILSDQLVSLTADMNEKFDSIMNILKRITSESS